MGKLDHLPPWVRDQILRQHPDGELPPLPEEWADAIVPAEPFDGPINLDPIAPVSEMEGQR